MLLCAFGDGAMEKPLVIGRAAKPRCFKNINLKQLPVHWYSNRKAWMTTSIMTDWLTKFNERMRKQNRSILLFMDNATSHPNLTLSNIKLVFFPPQTTSVLQPLDQGIIYTTKMYYRKKVLSRLCREIDDASNVAALAKKISVLDAIYWLASAVNMVTPHCIDGSFRKAGFDFAVLGDADFEPEDEVPLSNLIHLLRDCDMWDHEYITYDNDMPTECDSVDELAIAALYIESNDSSSDENESDQLETDEAVELPLLSNREMVSYAERMKETALKKGRTVLLNKLTEVLMQLDEESATNVRRQTIISDYFKVSNCE